MERIKLERSKGWRMPENTLKVDRSTRWGNPFKVTGDFTAQDAVDAFTNWLARMDYEKQKEYLAPLRGKNLACWCKPKPCHADVLLKWANEVEE